MKINVVLNENNDKSDEIRCGDDGDDVSAAVLLLMPLGVLPVSGKGPQSKPQLELK